ncbi:TPA: hypothetical protein ACFP4Y_000639, partial [Neisseria bacilliformis]
MSPPPQHAFPAAQQIFVFPPTPQPRARLRHTPYLSGRGRLKSVFQTASHCSARHPPPTQTVCRSLANVV